MVPIGAEPRLKHVEANFAEVDAFGTPVPSSVAIPAIPQVRFFVAIQYVSHRFAKLKHPGNILSNFGDFFLPQEL